MGRINGLRELNTLCELPFSIDFSYSQNYRFSFLFSLVQNEIALHVKHRLTDLSFVSLSVIQMISFDEVCLALNVQFIIIHLMSRH